MMRVSKAVSVRVAERDARAELEAWSARAIPDAAPLDAGDLVRLLRECIAMLELDADIAAGFTVNTVHYYRRKEIIDPPRGRTAAARYDVRHLWQIAGARLAGHLGLVTLAEARDAIRDAEESELLAFLAARVADARARAVMRTASPPVSVVARPLPTTAATMIALPGDAWCVVPAAHAAHRSSEAARELVRALAAALRVSHSS